MHSVRLEPTKLVFIGTRTTYQATGDASHICTENMQRRENCERGIREKLWNDVNTTAVWNDVENMERREKYDAELLYNSSRCKTREGCALNGTTGNVWKEGANTHETWNYTIEKYKNKERSWKNVE